jgi:hypothetical protein
MNIKQLRKQLRDIGINKAQAGFGTSEGYPAVFVRWNGQEEVFTGLDTNDPDDIALIKLEKFKDSNLG